MSDDRRKNRLKLVGSFAVLAIVFFIAAIWQFTGEARVNPYTVNQEAAKPQPRAVFGEEAKPAPEPILDTESRARATDATPNVAEINGLLDRWRASVINGNVDAQTILYAPRMEHFFRQRNVSRATVRREKARMMELYPEVNKYDISDVRVESAKENEAVVSFRKDWDMRGDRRFAGAERQRLKLRKIAGDWKIVSEEETKIYWVKRG